MSATEDAVSLRIAQALHDEIAEAKLSWWYLSFAGDEGWRGGVVVQAFGVADAIRQTHLKCINPGGEVRAVEWPTDIPEPVVDKRNRLLTKDEALSL